MGKRDYYDPMTMVVKDIPELFDECRKVVFTRLPGTNKFVAATWGALVEAHSMYQFAHGVITEEGKDLSDHYVWIKHGEHYAAAMLIRKIADGLGVSNFKPREGDTGEQVRQGRGHHRQGGDPGPTGPDRLAGGQLHLPGPEVPPAVPEASGDQAVGEAGDRTVGIPAPAGPVRGEAGGTTDT